MAKQNANQGLTARSAFESWTSLKAPDFTAQPRETVTMASLAAPKGRLEDLKAAVRAAYGVELPAHPQRVAGRDVAFVWMGPDHWLAIAERGTSNRDLERDLKSMLGDAANVTDQSDGRVIVRVSGSKAREVLVKGVPIDLHPRAFKPGSVAITHASHVGVIMWQIDEEPTYEIAMFRSYADTFLHWLEDAAKEFGAIHL